VGGSSSRAAPAAANSSERQNDRGKAVLTRGISRTTNGAGRQVGRMVSWRHPLALAALFPAAALLLMLGLVQSVGAASAMGIVPAAATCQPVIAHISQFRPGKTPDVSITGSCFGTAGAYSRADSNHFRVTDLGPNGTLKELEEAGKIPQTWWNACAGHTDAINGYVPNVVTCTVSTWTNTAITFYSFGPAYGEDGWVVNGGDKLVVEVWNANTLAGPSMYLLTAAGTPTSGGTGSGGGTGTATGGGTYPGTPTFGAGHRLLPSPLGHGQCQAVEFADRSVQAQIAVYNTNCNVTTGVLGPAADRAKGAPYKADGFNCTSVKERAGSTWASAWGSDYYAYNCADGAAQAAFNWGTDYTY
jgi:hypothetical protein